MDAASARPLHGTPPRQVLDPGQIGQDYANLVFLLKAENAGLNVQLWQDFLEGQSGPIGFMRSMVDRCRPPKA